MSDEANPSGPAEPTFHEGEVALQREAAVAERLARLGPQVIRSFMPEQHRRFFPELPFVVIGSLDARGQPTASLVAAPPGFVSSPDPGTLRIDSLPLADDPLEENLRAGAPLGLLGIQPHTRRRNRANGRVIRRDSAGFSLSVEQSFGNCPKYITPREPTYVGSAWRGGAIVSDHLGREQRDLMLAADTFYIASAYPAAADAGGRSHGVDVSHRGGPPGFVHFTDEATFIIPDFRGNNFYNTLGNLRLHAAAGLLFMDVRRGHLLLLEAAARDVLADHPLASPDATGRVVRFEVRRARFFAGASPLRFASATEE